jgi:hypothetical protein
MKRGKARFKFFAAFVTAVVYVVVFPAASGKELFLLPAWTVDLENAEASARAGEDEGEVSAFRLSGLLGYVNSRGNILFQEKLAYDAAVGPRFFVNYPAVPLNLVIRDRRGEFLGNIGGGGYPFIHRDKLFLLSPDGHGLSRVSERGDILWEKKFTSLITAADSGDESLVLGFLNGAFAVLGNDGEPEYEAPPAPGGLAVSLRAGIAGNALYFTGLSGGSPQRLRLFVRQEGGYSPLFEAPLQSSYRRAVVARYFSEPDYFVFEQPGGAGLFEVEKQKLLYVSLSGRLVELADERPEGLFLTLSIREDRMYCEAVLPDGSRVFGFSYKSPAGGTDIPYMLHAGKDSFLLGTGNRLYRLALEVS